MACLERERQPLRDGCHRPEMAHKTDPCASTNCRPAPGSCRRTRTIPTRRPRLKAIILEIPRASTLAKLSGRWGLEARTRFHGQPSREGKASWGPANPAFRGRAGVAGGYSGPKPVRSLRRRRQPRGAVKGVSRLACAGVQACPLLDRPAMGHSQSIALSVSVRAMGLAPRKFVGMALVLPPAHWYRFSSRPLECGLRARAHPRPELRQRGRKPQRLEAPNPRPPNPRMPRSKPHAQQPLPIRPG